MNCEVCGSEIAGSAVRVQIDGAKLLVCTQCKGLGKPIKETPTAFRNLPKRRAPIKAPPRSPPQPPKEMGEFDLAEDYADRVRRGRMKLNMPQEELARTVKEKVSVIQKIETGRIVPDVRLCKSLEHVLRVKLLVVREEIPPPGKSTVRQFTLGEIARMKGGRASQLED